MRRLAPLVLLAVVAAGCAAPATDVPAPAAPGAFTEVSGTLTSFDGTPIAYTILKPAAASASHKVPVVLSSHGWGGTRCTSAVEACRPEIEAILGAGLGYVSFDQRGHGASGGVARAMDPEFEVRDARLVIDEIARWDWVLLDGPGDPRLGATGDSYGGGFQLMTALEETRLEGRARLDALAPRITWNDLVTSLAPGGVPKTAHVTALHSAHVTGTARLHEDFVRWYALTMATGEVPPEAEAELRRHSPAWYAENGVLLDVPVLFLQGAEDTLFPLNEAWRTYETVLSPAARNVSMVVGHRAGHALPGLQAQRPDNPCAGEDRWTAPALVTRWQRVHLLGEPHDLGARMQLADAEGNCLRLDALPPRGAPRDVAPLTPVGTPVSLEAGARVLLPVAEGPLSLAGIPSFAANATGLHPDARLFFALAVGPSAANATVIGQQWTPVRGAPATSLALATDLRGVVERVPAGQSVFLVVAPAVEQYAAHGSRGPGAVVLTDVRVSLPFVDEAG
ncbi:MAG TPA: CocE/NonD family hydrolase [Candidatus Thermoplasmatota archaeon]|nr:CocE/NonD family hydrolase [Candidatus Thermoplasmatota archaeon]